MIRPRSRRRAFTLIEVILVLAIIVIIVAIAYPSLEGAYCQARLTAGADGFKAALLHARAQAVEDGIPYRVAILPGKGNFRVAPDLPSHWNGNGGDSSSSNDSTNPPFILDEHMPRGTWFSETLAPSESRSDGDTFYEPEKAPIGQYKTVAVFLPDGTARDDDQPPPICGKGGTPLMVHVRSLTGEVTVSRYQSEGGR